VGGGDQFVPLGTAATNRPSVPVPGGDDGEIGGMIGRGNRSTRRKPAQVSLCPPNPRGWVRGWVDPRAGLDDVEKRKFLTLPELELRPLGRPTVANRYSDYVIPVLKYLCR
jgi:hypothetical protein